MRAVLGRCEDEQVDELLALEREIRRAHLALLIRTKSLVTDEQNSKFATLRQEQQ